MLKALVAKAMPLLALVMLLGLACEQPSRTATPQPTADAPQEAQARLLLLEQYAGRLRMGASPRCTPRDCRRTSLSASRSLMEAGFWGP